MSLVANNSFYFRQSVIFGLNKYLQIDISIDNQGESAYHTQIYIKVQPHSLSLINSRECTFKDLGFYTCFISTNLTSKVQKKIIFDLSNLKPSNTNNNLSVDLSVKSLGQDGNPDDNDAVVELPVILKSSPYLEIGYYYRSIK